MLEKRFYGERVRRYTDKMANVLFDAYLRMGKERDARDLPPPTPEDVDILSWPQSWPDSRCGFDKPMKDVHSSEQTDVVIDNRLSTAYIYHAGQLARTMTRPGDAFWQAVRNRHLPGAVAEDEWQQLE